MKLCIIYFVASVVTAQHQSNLNPLGDEHRADSDPWYAANKDKYRNTWGHDCDHSIPARVVLFTDATHRSVDMYNQAQEGVFYSSIMKFNDATKYNVELALGRTRRLGYLQNHWDCYFFDANLDGANMSIEEAAKTAHGYVDEGSSQHVPPMSEVLTWLTGHERFFPRNKVDGVEPLRLAVIAPSQIDHSNPTYKIYWDTRTGPLCKTYIYTRWAHLGPLMTQQMKENGVKSLIVPNDVAFPGLIEWYHYMARKFLDVSEEHVSVVGIPKEYVLNNTYYDRLMEIIKDQLCWEEYKRTGVVGRSTTPEPVC